nr:hypothetical protein [Tanacetum cinerariifolium]
WVGWGSKVVSNVGDNVVDLVSEYLDLMPSGATTLIKHVMKVRHLNGFTKSKMLVGRGGQLNVAYVLEVKMLTNWKKRFKCHIIGIEPQLENIIKNAPFIPMAAGQRKPKEQWSRDERKTTNLDQRLKSLIMSVLSDDQIVSLTL